MAYTVLPAAAHRKVRWLNGGGWTSEIIAWPHRDKWVWRLSVADIDQDGPFSVFPDVDRTIALLRGSGFSLTAEQRPAVRITSPYEPFDFSGDDPTNCSLLSGPVQDLNLMVRRSGPPRRLRFVEIVEATELIDVELMVVLAGGLCLDGHDLSRLDAVRPGDAPLAVRPTSTGVEPTTIAIVT